jgi:hypothetical protein
MYEISLINPDESNYGNDFNKYINILTILLYRRPYKTTRPNVKQWFPGWTLPVWPVRQSWNLVPNPIFFKTPFPFWLGPGFANKTPEKIAFGFGQTENHVANPRHPIRLFFGKQDHGTGHGSRKCHYHQ